MYHPPFEPSRELAAGIPCVLHCYTTAASAYREKKSYLTISAEEGHVGKWSPKTYGLTPGMCLRGRFIIDPPPPQ